MTDYYMLECFEPDDWDDSALFEGSPRPEGVVSWRSGRRFPKPLPEPLEFTLQAEHSDQLLEMDNTEALILSKRLAAALSEAGVDNLDVYAAVIRHPGTGMVSHDYVAANVVGLVSAAKLGASGVVPGGMPGSLLDVDFDGVVLDPARARGALLFRLAENTSAIVVHAKVKDHLLANGIDTLAFVPPENWIG